MRGFLSSGTLGFYCTKNISDSPLSDYVSSILKLMTVSNQGYTFVREAPSLLALLHFKASMSVGKLKKHYHDIIDKHLICICPSL